MNPRAKDALLWGVVGLLSFLVLVQGYEILRGVGVDLTVKAGGAVAVGLASTVVTYLARGRVSTFDTQEAMDDRGDVDGDSSNLDDGESRS